jgi:hypothetical protein
LTAQVFGDASESLQGRGRRHVRAFTAARRQTGSCRVYSDAATFGEFPPRQAPANFNPQEMLGSVLNAAAKGIGNT